jgi:hypothetical protein
MFMQLRARAREFFSPSLGGFFLSPGRGLPTCDAVFSMAFEIFPTELPHPTSR